MENKDVGNSEDMKLETQNFLSAKALDKAVITVNKYGVLNTRFGIKKFLADGDNVLLLTKTLERQLINLGFKTGKELVGKTIYLKAVDVMVQGLMKKMWIIEKVE